MRRFVSLTLFALLAGAAACSSSTSPSNTDPNTVIMSALLLPQNETPPITNADATASGQATITFHVTRDSAGNVTTATVDYLAVANNFPATTTITAMHIHQNVAGLPGSVVAFPAYTSGEMAIVNGSGTFDKKAQSTDAAVVQNILNNPAGFYFNIHSALNGGGAIRGQLAKQ